MKTLGILIIMIMIVIVGMFPIIISFVTFNFWYIFLYFIWWLPTIVIGNILISIFEIFSK